MPFLSNAFQEGKRPPYIVVPDTNIPVPSEPIWHPWVLVPATTKLRWLISSPLELRVTVTTSDHQQRAGQSQDLARRALKALGPGLITGASDDDPSGIGTYSQAGAQLGFGIGWTMLLTYPLMAAIQEISARIGRTTGQGIAGNLCRHYPGWLLYGVVALLFVANTVNIGADLSAMGNAVRLLIGGPAPLYVVSRGSASVVAIVF